MTTALCLYIRCIYLSKLCLFLGLKFRLSRRRRNWVLVLLILSVLLLLKFGIKCEERQVVTASNEPLCKTEPVKSDLDRKGPQNGLNVDQFEFSLIPFKSCMGQELDLFVLVQSKPVHLRHRHFIRKTWGNPAFYRGKNIEVKYLNNIKSVNSRHCSKMLSN